VGGTTLIGSTLYSYVISAREITGPDTVRAKIWRTLTGEVVYDTQPGAPTTAAPATPLIRGQFVIS
jgi:hypothetical protein